MNNRGRRHQVAALIAVLSALVLAAAAPSAGAIAYCGIPVAPLSACTSNTGSVLLAYNEAKYSGAGSIDVCQKVQQGATLIDRLCARDRIWLMYPLPYGLYVGYVGNDSIWTHTIQGTYSVCCARSASNARTASTERTTPVTATATPPAAARADFAVFRAGESRPAATITRPEDQVSLTATDDELCLESTQLSGGSCQSYEKAADGQLLAAAICSPRLPNGRVVIYGAAPDGVTAIRAVTADATKIAETSVIANTFRLSLSTAQASNTDHFESVDEAGANSLGTVLPSDLSC